MSRFLELPVLGFRYLLLCVTPVALTGCTVQSTQLVVVVDSDLPRPFQPDVEVSNPDGDRPSGRGVQLAHAGAFSFGVVPRGGDDDRRARILEIGAIGE